MTDLSASPAAVAVVKTAGTLPIFLLAIPAGVLTDILDRRKFLSAIQLLLASVSITLMVLAQTGILVGALIGLPFLGGVAATLMGPTWQAIVPELEKREEAKSAVALQFPRYHHRPVNRSRSGRFAARRVWSGRNLWCRYRNLSRGHPALIW